MIIDVLDSIIHSQSTYLDEEWKVIYLIFDDIIQAEKQLGQNKKEVVDSLYSILEDICESNRFDYDNQYKEIFENLSNNLKKVIMNNPSYALYLELSPEGTLKEFENNLLNFTNLKRIQSDNNSNIPSMLRWSYLHLYNRIKDEKKKAKMVEIIITKNDELRAKNYGLYNIRKNFFAILKSIAKETNVYDHYKEILNSFIKEILYIKEMKEFKKGTIKVYKEKFSYVKESLDILISLTNENCSILTPMKVITLLETISSLINKPLVSQILDCNEQIVLVRILEFLSEIKYDENLNLVIGTFKTPSCFNVSSTLEISFPFIKLYNIAISFMKETNLPIIIYTASDLLMSILRIPYGFKDINALNLIRTLISIENKFRVSLSKSNDCEIVLKLIHIMQIIALKKTPDIRNKNMLQIKDGEFTMLFDNLFNILKYYLVHYIDDSDNSAIVSVSKGI